ncbi:MAG: DUF885 family protein, partial [Pyrinomonadaceae bacterium]|nr:DUF885 family protein [Pyrinomonadaceae bacterium]
MKKQFALVFALIIVSLSISVRTFAQPNDESEIRSIDEKLRVAFLTKDAKTLESLYAPDFYFVNSIGEVTTRDEFLKNNLDENYVFKSLAYNDEKVYLNKNTALSTYSLEREATYKGVDNGGKFRATRLYAKTNGKWKVVYQQSTDLPQTAKAANSNSETVKLYKMFEDYFEERLKLFPLEATQIADSRYNDKLPDTLGDAERAKQLAFFTKYKKQLALIDRSQLSESERLSLDIFKSELTRNADALNLFDIQEFPTDHFTPINQFSGLQLSFAQLGSGQGNQPFKTVKDYENFLGRINGFQIWTNTAIANMRKGIAAVIVQPKVLMERTLPQYQELIARD